MKKNFNVHFPMFEKIEVNGVNTHPLYEYMRKNSELYEPSTKASKVIPWNFGKFVLNSEGKVIKFLGPAIKPKELAPLIEKELGIKE